MTPPDPRAFRDALGHFATGVVVVSAHRGEGGDAAAMTVSSFNAVSLDPPLVLFSVSRAAPSLPVLLAAERFGVSVLRADQDHLSTRFAGGWKDGGLSRWDGIAPQPGRTGCPLIHPALARFECALHAVHDGGDHLIIVGDVLAFDAPGEGDPLIFFRGAYRGLAQADAGKDLS